ncbi:MAG: hypoxanthine phosphoribosyltransferase [Bdellovibrionaceae bacterium]|nr:hypoxanthine phosphoribosyltransferase [Pseudobdellovibrionaceae bacterium]NUM59062.1 hypoxanthine phosphoribosyltransferase [Pseudobdellovibrionaceae bacterium]
MRQIKDDMVPFIDKNEIEELVSKLAKKINEDYQDKEVVVICPLKGSIHFAADLVRKLNFNLQIDFVYLTSGGKGTPTRITKDISVNINNKHVIILEEIIDSGRKLSFLKNRLQTAGPASVKTACLLDKPARRDLPVKPDYVGKVIDDRYVVGYGMDQEEIGRNYARIYNLKN